MTTPLLALKELSVSQAAKEADHNETCRDLELFANLRFLDRDLATPPGSPAESDAYLVAGSPTGAWAGQAGNIAWFRGGAWKFHAPYEGLVAWVNDESVFLAYDGAIWAQITGSGSLSLYQLLDVDLPVSAGQADGTVLTWNAAGQVWEAANPTESLIVAVGDETTAITTGTAKVTFRMPYAFTLTAVRASLTTTSSSGNPAIDINEAGVSVLSTKITIDAGEKTSTTAATPPVISDSSLADDAEITIDIDTAGTDAAGLKVYLIGRRT